MILLQLETSPVLIPCKLDQRLVTGVERGESNGLEEDFFPKGSGSSLVLLPSGF